MSELDQPKWYILHTYSGYEAMVKDSLEKLIENNNLGDYIVDLKIPMEQVIEEKTSLILAPMRRKILGFLFFVFVAFAIVYLCASAQELPLDFRRTAPAYRLFGFFVLRVLLAERTVLFQDQSVGIVLLVLDAVIVSMLAFRAFECNFGSCRFCCHIENSIQKNYTPLRCVNKVYHTCGGLVNPF